MRVTGPTVRRRNHAWLQMRSLDRRATRLARRQQQKEDTSDDADTSGDEFVSSIDSSDDDSDTDGPTKTVRPPLASISVGLRTGRGARLLPTATAEVATGVTLGAGEGVEEVDGVESESESDGLESDGVESDGESSADESTAPPANTTLPPGAAPPPPPTITSATTISTIGSPPPPASTSAATRPSPPPKISTRPLSSESFSTVLPVPSSSRGSSSSLDELVTSLTRTSSLAPVASAITTSSPSVPITGSTQTDEAQVVSPDRQANEREGDGLGAAAQSGVSSGAAAGIALGVLAFVALLAGAALLWRKRRRDSGLPFFPQTRFRLKDDDESHPPSVTGPLPGHVGGPNAAKTNIQIMDDLMKAAYAADNGTNSMEGAYAPALPKLPPQLPQHQQTRVFLDEKAYFALAGPDAPATPKKPVMRWLDDVRTPTQPNGPEIPPSPAMPPSATMPRMVPGGGGGRVPDPPQPAYFGRDTMTTDTTNTSVRWYG
ncbi:hypothetical protein C8A00DRAFT_12350 [Chaetomidium leptoderma]|uniref:Uncharacterized protein n=1 Tax=Chaetomidium leptoderma TaxID=669021 RepID=A0AAN7A0C8_9PEZI|nr:hypothetical protein C8A00DRAFT_12350 [Chaetomidium leptoderma]